jgi:hypothetical protein
VRIWSARPTGGAARMDTLHMHVAPLLETYDVDATSIPPGKFPSSWPLEWLFRGATSLLRAVSAHSMQLEWLPPDRQCSKGQVYRQQCQHYLTPDDPGLQH